MSPTVLRFGPFQARIFTRNEHPPAHIHVFRDDVEVKIELGTWKVLSNRGFTSKDIRKIIENLKPYEEMLLEAWRQYVEDQKEEN